MEAGRQQAAGDARRATDSQMGSKALLRCAEGVRAQAGTPPAPPHGHGQGAALPTLRAPPAHPPGHRRLVLGVGQPRGDEAGQLCGAGQAGVEGHPCLMQCQHASARPSTALLPLAPRRQGPRCPVAPRKQPSAAHPRA